MDCPNIFAFENNHCDGCGTPPEYDLNKYFVKLGENKYCEQILCVMNKESGQFHFHHGDCGWDSVHYIDSTIILDEKERQFIYQTYREQKERY